MILNEIMISKSELEPLTSWLRIRALATRLFLDGYFSLSPLLKMKMTKTSNIGVLILLSFCFLFHVSEAIVDHPLQSQKSLDQILVLPGQPGIPSFEQYSGYVTVDEKAGRALFYYFVEVADPSFKDCAPLLLWLNGGPGCSSLGYGALSEIGPYRVKSDGKTLYENEYSWNKVANVLFLESPVGVGFSYSNTSTHIKRKNDKNTAADSYVFLLNWMERFPEYKGRGFYIIGESYGGHYAPQLAHTILRKNNKYGNSKNINLKGIALGNPLLQEEVQDWGFFEYLWSHGVISDQLLQNVHFACDFSLPFGSSRGKECDKLTSATRAEARRFNVYNIYAPLCHSNITTLIPKDTSLTGFDPCNNVYVHHYLNLAEVQLALHAKFTSWVVCRNAEEIYDIREVLGKTTLPLLPNIMANGVPILVFSGDFDSVVSFISTKNALKKLKLKEVVQWSPWKSDDEVVGHRIVYEGGLTFTTIRGAGHMVPSYKPKQALRMIQQFLKGQGNF